VITVTRFYPITNELIQQVKTTGVKNIFINAGPGQIPPKPHPTPKITAPSINL